MLFLCNQEQDKDPIIPTYIQHSVGSPDHKNEARKRKGSQIGEEKAKLSLFADDVITVCRGLKTLLRNVRTNQLTQ